MIEPLRFMATETFNNRAVSSRLPNDQELMDKINEIIWYLNDQEKAMKCNEGLEDEHENKPCYCAGHKECHECGRKIRS